MDHVFSRCSKLAQKEYQKRHEKLDKIVYWKLVKKHNFVDKKKKKYECKAESIFENEDYNEDYKVLQDFAI